MHVHAHNLCDFGGEEIQHTKLQPSEIFNILNQKYFFEVIDGSRSKWRECCTTPLLTWLISIRYRDMSLKECFTEL